MEPENEPRSTPEVVFPLRVDWNGYRPVYKLGNEGGNCSFGCKFCGVGRSPRVDSAANISLFDNLHATYLREIAGLYHPAIFNRGNVTDPKAFSPATLDHILNAFANDGRVTYVSLNSREITATTAVLDRLAGPGLPFPIHFIFGQESFSESASRILGKKNRGEMERFVWKLKRYNQEHLPRDVTKRYIFGLDVNLVFLPELYLEAGESRSGHEAKIAGGLADDLRQLLARADPLVPIEVNIHPYYEVPSLPYQRADLFMLLRMMPELQCIIEQHNARSGGAEAHLFLGVVFVRNGFGALNRDGRESLLELQAAIDSFNRTGRTKCIHSPKADSTTAAQPEIVNVEQFRQIDAATPGEGPLL